MEEDIRVKARPQTVATENIGGGYERNSVSESSVRQALHRKVNRGVYSPPTLPTLSKYRMKVHGSSGRRQHWSQGGEVHLFSPLPTRFDKRMHHRSVKILRNRRAMTPTASMMRQKGKRKKKFVRRKKSSRSSSMRKKKRRKTPVKRDPFQPLPRPFSSVSGVPYAPLQDPMFRRIEPKYTNLAKEIEELSHHIPQRQVRNKFEDVIDCPNLKLRVVISKRLKDFNNLVSGNNEKKSYHKRERDEVHLNLILEQKTEFNPMSWMKKVGLRDAFLEDLFSEYLLM